MFASSTNNGVQQNLASFFYSIGLNYQPLYPRGHGLYAAVAYCLGTNEGELRKKVIEHYRAYPESFRAEMGLAVSAPIEDLLSAIGAGQEWSEEWEMRLLMAALKRPIIALDTQGAINNRLQFQSEGEPIFVCRSDGHYDGLRLNGTLTAQGVMTQLALMSYPVASPPPYLTVVIAGERNAPSGTQIHAMPTPQVGVDTVNLLQQAGLTEALRQRMAGASPFSSSPTQFLSPTVGIYGQVNEGVSIGNTTTSPYNPFAAPAVAPLMQAMAEQIRQQQTAPINLTFANTVMHQPYLASTQPLSSGRSSIPPSSVPGYPYLTPYAPYSFLARDAEATRQTADSLPLSSTPGLTAASMASFFSSSAAPNAFPRPPSPMNRGFIEDEWVRLRQKQDYELSLRYQRIQYIERKDKLKQIQDWLEGSFSEEATTKGARLLYLWGITGSGKTVLAQDIVVHLQRQQRGVSESKAYWLNANHFMQWKADLQEVAALVTRVMAKEPKLSVGKLISQLYTTLENKDKANAQDQRSMTTFLIDDVDLSQWQEKEQDVFYQWLETMAHLSQVIFIITSQQAMDEVIAKELLPVSACCLLLDLSEGLTLLQAQELMKAQAGLDEMTVKALNTYLPLIPVELTYLGLDVMDACQRAKKNRKEWRTEDYRQYLISIETRSYGAHDKDIQHKLRPNNVNEDLPQSRPHTPISGVEQALERWCSRMQVDSDDRRIAWEILQDCSCLVGWWLSQDLLHALIRYRLKGIPISHANHSTEDRVYRILDMCKEFCLLAEPIRKYQPWETALCRMYERVQAVIRRRQAPEMVSRRAKELSDFFVSTLINDVANIKQVEDYRLQQGLCYQLVHLEAIASGNSLAIKNNFPEDWGDRKKQAYIALGDYAWCALGQIGQAGEWYEHLPEHHPQIFLRAAGITFYMLEGWDLINDTDSFRQMLITMAELNPIDETELHSIFENEGYREAILLLKNLINGELLPLFNLSVTHTPLWLIGMLCFSMSVGEKKSQAIVMLEKMAEQEPMDAFIKQVWMMSKVAFLITHQDYLEAKILAIKVTKNFPYHLKGWLDLATVHLALGEGKPAKACLEKGTQYCASTSLIQQRKEYARLLMQFGLLEEAESVIATFFEEAAEIGERDENERIDIFPERYQLRGCLQSKQGKQEAAYIDIKEYLILSASDYPSVLSYALSWDLFELAYYAIKYELTSGGKASKKGITPLMLACGNEKSDMVRLLIECTDVNSCLVGEELTALHIACSQDDFTCVETLLKHPEVKVNLAQKDGFTPLMYACTRGYVNYVRALLAVPGIDINAQDKLEGNTALTIACAFGHADIVKLLLKEQEVKIDQTNYPGGTPLFYAIISESVKCVGLLLKKKASIKAVSLDVGRANSVFQVFCQTNKDNPQLLQKRLEKLWFHHPKGEERVKAFLRQLQSPASSEESSIVQIKLLWQAYALRNISIMERLIDAGCLLEEVDEEGLTLLARACGDGEQQIVELLIEKGAKVNATIETESYQGLTALHLACEQGHLACIQALLARPEIDVNVVEKKYGLMPLMIACAMGYVDCVQALLAVPGININAKDKLEGSTVLIQACRLGHAAIVERLLQEQELDIDQTDNWGAAPLFYAIVNDFVECVHLLLHKGASINTVSIDVGKMNSVLQAAARQVNPQFLQARVARMWSHHPKSEERVKEYMGQFQSPIPPVESFVIRGSLLWLAYGGRNISIMEGLIGVGCSLEEVDEDGLTLLARACSEGEPQIVLLLIAKGAKVNAAIEVEGYHGGTALHLACELGQLACVQALLAHPEIKINGGNYGITPLMIACINGHIGCVQALLSMSGVKINAQNKLEGNTGLMLACRFGHAAIVKRLLKEQGVSVNQLNYAGATPIFCAIMSGSVECVDLLLKAGALINDVVYDFGKAASAFQVACQVNEAVPQLLQKKMKEAYAYYSEGEELAKRFIQQMQSPAFPLEASVVRIKLLWQAYGLRNVSVLGRLIDADCPLEEVNEEGLTLLMRACLDGEQRIVALLIAKGNNKGIKVNAAIEAEEAQGMTALHLACQQGHFACVQALLGHPEINVNISQKDGVTPLMLACALGHVECVIALLTVKGIDLSIQDKLDGSTALMTACRLGHAAIVGRLLKEQEVDVNQTNDVGNTPIFCAISSGSVECVDLLLKAGASIDAVSIDVAQHLRQTNPQDLQKQLEERWGHYPGGKERVKELMQQLQPSTLPSESFILPVSLLSQAYESRNIPIIERLIDAGCLLDEVDEEGLTLLMRACIDEENQIILLLIAKGAKINVRAIEAEENQGLPFFLCLACEQGHITCLQALLAHPKNDVNVMTGKGGLTPLMLVCMYGYVNCVQALLAVPGINIDARDKLLGNTALMWACQMGNMNVIQCFIDVACSQVAISAGIYEQLGNIYFSLSETARAISAYEQALKCNAERYDLYHNLACFYFTQGKIGEADTHFQIAMAHHRTPGILVEYSHFLVKQNRFDEALGYLQQCLTHIEEGEVGYGITEIHTAVPVISSMVKAHPSVKFSFSAKGLALYLRAYCHLAKKNDKPACRQSIELFAQWIELTCQQPQASGIEQASYYFLLGDNYEGLQEENQARVYYERACQLNARFVHIVKSKFTPCYLPGDKKAFTNKQQTLKTRYSISLQDTAMESLEKLFRCAAAEGELEVLRDGYENQGINIDTQDSKPRNLKTALHWACIRKHEEIINYLLAQDARFDIEDAQGKMAWEYVLDTPLIALFKIHPDRLLKKYGITLFPGFVACWNQLLEIAIEGNCLADIRYCVEVLGIDMNVVNFHSPYRRRPLHWAVIKHGARGDLPDAAGKTAFIYAVEAENEELTALFPITPETKEQLLSAPKIENPQHPQEAIRLKNQAGDELSDNELQTIYHSNQESLQEWRRQMEYLQAFVDGNKLVVASEVRDLQAYLESMLEYIPRNLDIPQLLMEKALRIIHGHIQALESKRQEVSLKVPVASSTPFWANPTSSAKRTVADISFVNDAEAQQFCEQNGLTEFRAIIRDGNCFFHAVLAALPPDHRWNQMVAGHLKLREQAVQYMRNNPERFPVGCIENESLEDYLHRMSQPTQWAEGAIIDATALLLNITINIIELEKHQNEIITSELESPEGQIILLRVNQKHYHLGMPLQPVMRQLEVRPF